MKISAYLDREPVDLFPLHLYDITNPVLVAEIESARFLPLSAARRQIEASPDDYTDESMATLHRESLIASALKSLSPREEKVIRAFYGFDDDERTLGSLAKDLEVTTERVRQIANSARRKLIQPLRELVVRGQA